jgi:hypothetical protein
VAFNGSGTHVRVMDWTADLAGAIPVTAARMDSEHDDISTALSSLICRDGQSTTTARIPFAAGTSAAAGTTASVSYSQTNDNNTGLYFPATDQWGLVAGGTSVLNGTATGISVTGTFSASGTGAVTGDFAINTNKFTVTAASGNTAVAGTLAVTGASTLTGATAVTGDFAVNTNKFTVTAASGNTLVAGTLAVTGAATLSSTLAAGNTTITGTLAASGNVAINTDKFTVAAASGNTLVAGTLAVTGASTLTGALTANNAAGITGKNTPKAMVNFTTNGSAVVTINSSFNITSVATATVESGNGWQVTFTNAMPSANYVAVTVGRTSGGTSATMIHSTRTTTTFDFLLQQVGAGGLRNNLTVDMVFFDPT